MNSTLQAAIVAAQAAAGVIRAAAADPGALQVRAKQPNDFVTQVDLASERVIVQTLLDAFPQHGVRSEESKRLHGNAEAEHVWIVDPLDGTNNFIHGYPAYAVSIALAVRGRVEVGVVLDVSADLLFQATRGGGAWCQGERLQVSERPSLDGALVSTSAPFRPGPNFERSMQMLGAVMARVGAVRRSGSAALDLARVAAGQCDASFDLGLNAWDVAAGSLLVSEAGGEVSSFGGGADFLESKQCIAANPALHRALVPLLQPFTPGAPSQNGH
ncbi:MAG TPA: inositol monophosphatase family protein [Rubrivivax sp.]